MLFYFLKLLLKLLFLMQDIALAQQDRRITRKKAGPAGKERRLALVIRGGGWGYSARVCRSADRGRREPAYGNYFLGFRLARTR